MHNSVPQAMNRLAVRLRYAVTQTGVSQFVQRVLQPPLGPSPRCIATSRLDDAHLLTAIHICPACAQSMARHLKLCAAQSFAAHAHTLFAIRTPWTAQARLPSHRKPGTNRASFALAHAVRCHASCVRVNLSSSAPIRSSAHAFLTSLTLVAAAIQQAESACAAEHALRPAVLQERLVDGGHHSLLGVLRLLDDQSLEETCQNGREVVQLDVGRQHSVQNDEEIGGASIRS
ncbi:hypothetical protein BC834DRAFT_189086 [Gloeopeniophorella convolvens]|nr:hypothetical protein BC834DRAFT_189086 [Gloeopeniophorella convolvens]